MFTYARETLEKTGQPPPQQHDDVEGPDEDSVMTGTSSPANGSRSEDEKDSDDERMYRGFKCLFFMIEHLTARERFLNDSCVWK